MPAHRKTHYGHPAKAKPGAPQDGAERPRIRQHRRRHPPPSSAGAEAGAEAGPASSGPASRFHSPPSSAGDLRYHKRIVRSRPQMGHNLTSARACSLAKFNFCPHETRGSYSQGSRVGTKIMITTSCLAQVRRPRQSVPAHRKTHYGVRLTDSWFVPAPGRWWVVVLALTHCV